jgi:hypothetical protein
MRAFSFAALIAGGGRGGREGGGGGARGGMCRPSGESGIHSCTAIRSAEAD